jgi:hypothetical protein
VWIDKPLVNTGKIGRLWQSHQRHLIPTSIQLNFAAMGEETKTFLIKVEKMYRFINLKSS